MFYRSLIFCCLFIALMCAPALGDDAPAWLQQAAAVSLPAYDKDVKAVVLYHEQNVSVASDGRVVTTTTYAVRVLTREGRTYARADEAYLTDGGKVRELKAWLIRPSGQIKRYGKDETVDIAVSPDDIYNELRARVIIAKDDAEPGAVFGYQSVTEDRSWNSQTEWTFQDELPTLVSRFTLQLPTGWRADGITFNHTPIAPAVAGTNYTWELRDLPAVAAEPASPAWTNIVPRLAVSYFPPDGATIAGVRPFASWTDVSRWVSELADPQADANDALTAKATQLTQGAKTELEKIQAIGRFVQGIQYISIDMSVGHGGGIRPHAATEVFTKAYGDCKDKANLMRAMLKVVGIQSYLVAIYSGDPNYVRDEWPSPGQFNHCIIAVKVSDATQAATVTQHPKLGRLLIFDATDDDTPVGDLPDHEQGSFALVIAGADGTLMRMPTTPPEANQLERQADVSLAADGSINATVRERAQGQSAALARGEFKHFSRPEYQQIIQAWVARGANGAQVTKVEPTDTRNEGRFALDVEFSANRYGQLMQDRLLVFKPAIVSRRESLTLTAATRKHPVVLSPFAYTETVKVKLPAGFDVDELPDAVKLDTPFGSYVATYAVKDGQLNFTRTMIQRAATIPVEQYAAVRGFFERIRAAEQAPVVLARK
jgi:hypothetical protein